MTPSMESELRRIAADRNLLEIARLAIEAELVDRRDRYMFVLRNNGLVIRDRDGTDSSIVRLGSEHAVQIGLEAIANHLSER